MRESWPAEQLGRHVELISGQHIEASLCNEKGYGKPYLTGPADFPDGEIFVSKFTQSPKVVCEPGDLLITVKGSGTGKTTIARRSYCISRQLMAVRPTSMDGGYLRHVLSAQTARMRADALGFIPGIGRSDVLSMLVGVPRLPEQQQIAEILDTLDDAIRKTEEIIAKLKKVKQGLLHDLLTRGIDENGELRDPVRHPGQFKDSPLGRIPKSWKVLPAETVCDAVIDCKNRTPPITESGYPVLRTPNIRGGEFVTAGLVYTDQESYETWTTRGKPRARDVLITREAPVGEVCLLPEWLGDACLGQRMMMYRPDPTQLNNQFMVVALQSQAVQKTLIDWAGGSTVGHVRVGDIRRLPVHVPPVVEQVAIAATWDALRGRLTDEKRFLAKLQLLKKGLMEDLLTGRVRVTPLLWDAVE